MKEIPVNSFIRSTKNFLGKSHFFNSLTLKGMLVSKLTIFRENSSCISNKAIAQYLLNERLVSKIFICMSCLLAPLLSAHEGLGIEGEEVETISHLVEVTASQLAMQKELKALMEQFLQLKKQFMQGEEEKKVGFQMVQIARKILNHLKQEHLQDLVSNAYLEELTFFSTLSKAASP